MTTEVQEMTTTRGAEEIKEVVNCADLRPKANSPPRLFKNSPDFFHLTVNVQCLDRIFR
jgi:hypothetical protein